MRRPILGTGFPKPVPNNIAPTSLSALTLLDLRALALDLQSRVYLLTAYVLPVGAAPGTSFNVYQQVGTATPLLVANIFINAPSSAPIKVLDRFPMRGNMRALAIQPSVAASDLRVFGYFELEGEIVDLQGDRPLQPTNDLVAPFLGGATAFAIGGGGPVQALTAAYIDTLTLSYITVGEGTPALLTLVGETDLPLAPDAALANPIQLFDGIPMVASDPLLIDTTNSSATVWGTFKRG